MQNPWHPSQVSTVGLLPDGRTLGAIGCTNDRLHLFCARSHRRLSAIEGLPLGRGVGVAFSFDWRTLFVSAPASNVQDDNLLMVDLKTGNSRVLEDACRVIGHSPDGALTFLLASKGDRLHVLRHRLPLVENPQSLSDDGG